MKRLIFAELVEEDVGVAAAHLATGHVAHPTHTHKYNNKNTPLWLKRDNSDEIA